MTLNTFHLITSYKKHMNREKVLNNGKQMTLVQSVISKRNLTKLRRHDRAVTFIVRDFQEHISILSLYISFVRN